MTTSVKERVQNGAFPPEVSRPGVYVVAGPADTEDAIIFGCMEFLLRGARKGEKTAVIINGIRKEEYLLVAEKLAPDFVEYHKKGMIEILGLEEWFWTLKSEAESRKGRERYIKNVNSAVREAVIESGIKRIAIPLPAFLVRGDYDLANAIMNVFRIPGVMVMAIKGQQSYGMEEEAATGLIKVGKAEDGRIEVSVTKWPGEIGQAVTYLRSTPTGIAVVDPPHILNKVRT